MRTHSAAQLQHAVPPRAFKQMPYQRGWYWLYLEQGSVDLFNGDYATRPCDAAKLGQHRAQFSISQVLADICIPHRADACIG